MYNWSRQYILLEHDDDRQLLFWVSLVSTTEELLEGKSSGSSIEIREYGRRDVTLTMWHPLSIKGAKLR
jgi:hypothetical protein